MKKKRVLCFALVLVMGMTNVQCVSAEKKNGFVYNASRYNVKWKKLEYFWVKSSAGGKLGTFSYLTGLGRRKKSNNYVLMFKEVMTPHEEPALMGHNILGMGIYGYGLSEYMSLNVTLASLDDYQPQNNPSSDSVELSVGASKDGPDISASYSITHNDLDITSKCNTKKKLYKIVYDYQPSFTNPIADNTYVANESIQLSEAEFTTSKTTVTFTVNYEARFGVADDDDASPWLIWLNNVSKATGSRTYTYNISKI